MKGEEPAWYERPDPDTGEVGLRFRCTMCGNCCTGPGGFVLVSDDEAAALARRLGIDVAEFLERFTRESSRGRSLTETPTEHGLDCVFLDRTTMPGKAVCGVYEDRPEQCRTWPFWNSNLASKRSWVLAGRNCPGMDRGPLYSVQQIRVLRDRIDI